MYFQIVKRIIDEVVDLHADSSGQTAPEVLNEIRAQIEATSGQHWSDDDPEIEYNDPLCRIGYLYSHATANATVFEKALSDSDYPSRKMRNGSRGTLNICSMGGGPGTELLGISKYLSQHPYLVQPRRIEFTIVDEVQEWADTWTQLAEASEEELRSSLASYDIEPPVISPQFLGFDVLDPSTYKKFPHIFKKTDMVVFNYLFSENKAKLDAVQQALAELAKTTREDCAFVVIDRLESNPIFTNKVVKLFESAFGVEVCCLYRRGTIDSDEQTSQMGGKLIDSLGRWPRTTFKAFWFMVARQ